MKISAIIVTRGDVDLGPCLTSIDADEIIICRGHGGVWERYEAASRAKHDVIYTQDDDCVVEFPAVVAEYEQGRVVCNMPAWKRSEYPDAIALVGWGGVFHRSALAAFGRYFAQFPDEEGVFWREADRVFTGLNPLKLIDVPFMNLPSATAPDRLGAQAEHGQMLQEIRRRIGVVRAVRVSPS